jgi:hypothetical protein
MAKWLEKGENGVREKMQRKWGQSKLKALYAPFNSMEPVLLCFHDCHI